MSFSSLRRRALALIAAYAIALQPLWAAFAPPAVAGLADGHAVICLAGAGGAGQPASNGGACACPCVMPGCGGNGNSPDRIALVGLTPASALAPLPAFDVAWPHATTRRPQLPRAPPIA